MAVKRAQEIGGAHLSLSAIAFVAGGDGVVWGVVAAGGDGDYVVEGPSALSQSAEAVEAAGLFAGEAGGAEGFAAEAAGGAATAALGKQARS